MGRVRIHYPQAAEAVLAQKVPVTLGSLAVGETITLDVDGAPREWIVVHHGKPSSIYSSTFTGGTILMMKDTYENCQWHSSNVNDYANSTIHAYLNSTFLAKLEPAVQAAVRQVKIPYRPGSGHSTTVASGESGLAAKVFVLSGREVGLTSIGGITLPLDGAKLDFFDDGAGDAANKKRIARYGWVQGTAIWWLRSPQNDGGYGATCATIVNSDGSGYMRECSVAASHRPALVLPDNLELPTPATLTDLQGNPLSIQAEQISGGVRMATGSYTGTGTYGASNPNRLTFNFEPKLVIVSGGRLHFLAINPEEDATTAIRSSSELQEYANGFKQKVSWEANTITWYCVTRTLSGTTQLNESGVRYSYIALG